MVFLILMRKIFLASSVLIFLLTISGYLSAQIPTRNPTDDSDIQSAYSMECLLPPDMGAERNMMGTTVTSNLGKPPPSITMNLNGQCSSPTGCDLTLCVIEKKGDKFGDLQVGQRTQRSDVDHSGEKCTTGNATKDIHYFGSDNTRITKASLTASSLTDNHISYGPVTNLEVILNNPQPHDFYSFYATGDRGTVIPAVTQGLIPTIADNRTQQVGQITLSFSPSISLAPGEKADCESIFWDPYGRVFDGISLEPLNKNEAKVTLLNKDDSIVSIPGNNVSTDILGKYNILIKDDGEYKLNVTPLTSHLFSSFIPNNFYKELYETIFMPGDPAFYESADNPKRVDVALKPVSTPYERPIDVVQTDYKQVWANGKKYVKIELRVTHPKSLVKLIVNDIVVKENGEGKALSIEADKDGFWRVLVRHYKVLSQRGFRVQVSKNPKYYMYAGQPSSALILNLDPILSYIEGYAYDDFGNIIPNAKVQVRLKINDSVFYETTTDDKGYFIVQPTNLPPLDYYFVFVNPEDNSVLKKTTSKFVADNTSYIEQQKLNLLKGEKDGRSVVIENNARDSNLFEDSFNENSRFKDMNKTEVKANKIGKNFYPIVFIVFFLVILLFVFVFFYFKKNFRSIS